MYTYVYFDNVLTYSLHFIMLQLKTNIEMYLFNTTPIKLAKQNICFNTSNLFFKLIFTKFFERIVSPLPTFNVP